MNLGSQTTTPPPQSNLGPYAGLPGGYQPSAFVPASSGSGPMPRQSKLVLWLAIGAGSGVLLLVIFGMVLITVLKSPPPAAESSTSVASSTSADATNPPSASTPPTAASPSNTAATSEQRVQPNTGATTESAHQPSGSAENPVSPPATPSAKPSEKFDPPKLPDAVALEVTIVIEGAVETRFTGVRGFAIRWPGVNQPIIVTALTPFARPNAPLPLDAADLVKRFKSGEVQNIANGSVCGAIERVVPVQGSASSGGGAVTDTDLSGDIAAFRARADAKLGMLQLATTPAKPSDTIWLLRSDSGSVELQRATVRLAKEKVLLYELSDSASPPEAGGEGLPLLNSNGEVVAVHLNATQGQPRYGLANPVANVRARIQAAVPSSPETPAKDTAQAPDPPKLPEASILEVKFTMRKLKCEAHCFAIQWPKVKRPIVVTAFSQFNHEGYVAGLKTVKVGSLIDRSNKRYVGRIEGVLPIQSSASKVERDEKITDSQLSKDVTAFWGQPDAKSPFSTLSLATSPAKKGDTIWLVNAPTVSGESEVSLLRVTVELADANVLVYKLPERANFPTHGEGLPLLNASGEVVAVHLDIAAYDQQFVGVANPVSNIRACIEAVLKGRSTN
jgi:hypothetical protein